ncbi:MAG: hypothetical protein Q7S29_05780 [Candidatus Peribacter sp.]|nr:hypothetical protein [Candidatus Peribacter sp.]
MNNLLNLRVIILAIIVAGVVGSALWLRASSGEDSWLCVDGQWIRHGNPSAAMPQVPCTQAAIPTAQQTVSPTLVPADQPVKTFTSADFTLSYPDWPVMNQAMILEPERTKVAVSNAGCALLVTVRTLPPDADFQTSIEQLLSEQTARANVRIIQKDISKTASHVEGEFSVQNRDIRSSQYGYVTSKNQFYSVVFASEKSVFDAACKPVVATTIKSVKVQ